MVMLTRLLFYTGAGFPPDKEAQNGKGYEYVLVAPKQANPNKGQAKKSAPCTSKRQMANAAPSGHPKQWMWIREWELVCQLFFASGFYLEECV